jgi:hypothetical protein
MQGDDKRQALAPVLGMDPLHPIGPAIGRKELELPDDAVEDELVGHGSLPWRCGCSPRAYRRSCVLGATTAATGRAEVRLEVMPATVVESPKLVVAADPTACA